MEPILVTGVRLSSVVPATVTGKNKPHNLTAMDLAVKLHYVRAVYFFKASPSVQSLTVDDLKRPMFRLLHTFHPPVSGRIRRSEPGDGDPTRGRRPYIRCNDSGVRIVEATVQGFTVEEWLADDDHRSVDHDHLVYDQVLGPDLGFSPLVVLQMTRFKCGGISIGLNWAHVLGDAFSASAFMNLLGLTMADHEIPEPIKPEITEHKYPVNDKLSSIKKIEPVGDYWLPTNKRKMGRHTFRLSSEQIEHMKSRHTVQGKTFSGVEILYAVVWKSLLNVQEGSGPGIVTVCDGGRTLTCCNDEIVISVVEIGDLSEKEAGIAGLTALISEKKMVENNTIEETIEKDGGVSDFILYGANLTFVNMEGADLYGFELNGEKPEFVNYAIHGVGDEGVVLVFPGSEGKGKFAMVVTVVMPEEQVAKFKDEFKNYWDVI